MKKEKKINVSVVGCGRWGPNLIRNFFQISEVKLGMICDLEENKLEAIKEQYADVGITQDYNNLLNDTEINAIAIATPVATHFELAKKALEKGKHVFVEKPETTNSKEAGELLKLAKDKNRILMVDHTFKYSPAINKIKEIINNKELGNIHYLHASWLSLGSLQPEVNVIWDLAVHVFSVLTYMLEKKPLSLNAKAQGYFRQEIEEVAVITLTFPGNIKAFVIVSWTEPEKTRKITLIGSRKMLVYNMMDSHQIKVYNKSVNIDENGITYLDKETEPRKIEEAEPLEIACSHFVDCIKNNKKPRSSGEEGLNIMEILEATDKSIKNNGQEILLN